MNRNDYVDFTRLCEARDSQQMTPMSWAWFDLMRCHDDALRTELWRLYSNRKDLWENGVNLLYLKYPELKAVKVAETSPACQADLKLLQTALDEAAAALNNFIFEHCADIYFEVAS